MDAFLKYLGNTDDYGKRLFSCEAPGPVILVWADFANGSDLSGLTMVSELGIKHPQKELSMVVYKLIQHQLQSTLPIFDIQYSSDASTFYINGIKYDGIGAAKFLSKNLNIKIGANPAKKANDSSQIVDAFHIWSREAFDGIAVRKIDVDALLLSKKGDKIETLIEIKRSKVKPVGKWLPYIDSTSKNTDYWNYLMAINLSKILYADFITFHHEKINEELFTDDDLVDQFKFEFNSIISKETIEQFGSEQNRKVFDGLKFR